MKDFFRRKAHSVGTAGIYTGASMLFNDAGPYVLTVVIAFMLGVLITVLLKAMSGNKAGDISKTSGR